MIRALEAATDPLFPLRGWCWTDLGGETFAAAAHGLEALDPATIAPAARHLPKQRIPNAR